MTTPSIESGIPLPKGKATGKCAILRQMKPGDSIEFPLSEKGSWNNSAHIIFGSGNYAVRTQPGGKVRLWKK